MDAEALLEFVGDLHGSLEPDDFRVHLLEALARLVPSEWVSLNEIVPEPGALLFHSRPAPPEHLRDPWARLGHENPLVQRFNRTGDGRAYRFSDVVAPDELRALALYREVYAPLGIEHQIAFVIRTEPDHFLGLALSREKGDYTDVERALLDRARPFIVQAHRNVIEHARCSDPGPRLRAALMGAGLTAREAEVVGGVAVGRSVTVIAAGLGVTPRTVHKHQQNSYAKLGVTSRAGAADAAWELYARFGNVGLAQGR